MKSLVSLNLIGLVLEFRTSACLSDFDSFPFIQIISLGGAAGAVDEETFISSFEEVKKVRPLLEK